VRAAPSALIVVAGMTLYFWIPLAAEFTQTVPDDMRGQGVGLLMTTMRVTQGVAVLIFGLAAQNAPSSTVIAVSGTIGTVMAIVLSVAWIRVSRSATVAVAPGAASPRGEAVK
jgi:hypothetical protein